MAPQLGVGRAMPYPKGWVRGYHVPTRRFQRDAAMTVLQADPSIDNRQLNNEQFREKLLFNVQLSFVILGEEERSPFRGSCGVLKGKIELNDCSK